MKLLSYEWTRERIEALEALVKDGLSASQIAAEIGCPSRNAVIGKAHRLGLKIGASRAATPRRPVSVRKPKPAKLKSAVPAAPLPVVEPPPRPTLAEALEVVALANAHADALPGSRMLTLLDLPVLGACRWPYGDPRSEGFRFCGAECSPAMVYCPTHRKVGSTPRAEVVQASGRRP